MRRPACQSELFRSHALFSVQAAQMAFFTAFLPAPDRGSIRPREWEKLPAGKNPWPRKRPRCGRIRGSGPGPRSSPGHRQSPAAGLRPQTALPAVGPHPAGGAGGPPP